MAIDARIPLMGQGFDIGQMYDRADRRKEAQQRNQEHQEDRDNKRRLGDLLPQAVNGDRSALEQIAGINPDLFLRMDANQREQVKAHTADLIQAVRWADSPEKWDMVIDHYAKEGVDLNQYRGQPQLREKALMQLGKIGQYLDTAPKMDIRGTEPGGGLYGVDPLTGRTKVLVQPNDGSHPMGAPAQSGIPPGAVDMLRQNPGLKADFDAKYGPGAADRALGGQSQSGSGGFL